jgi:hypothetical protein
MIDLIQCQISKEDFDSEVWRREDMNARLRTIIAGQRPTTGRIWLLI